MSEAEKEREAIVAWLRSVATEWENLGNNEVWAALLTDAAAIERGDHHKG